jgi:hypothetical protein
MRIARNAICENPINASLPMFHAAAITFRRPSCEDVTSTVGP